MEAEKSLIVEFEQLDNGICLTRCPHGVKCMVNSMTCEACQCNWGLKEYKKLKCTGHRLKKEEIK